MTTYTLAFLLLTPNHAVRSIDGVYRNVYADVRIELAGESYSIEEGHPLSLSAPRQQVNFQDGSVRRGRHELTLVPFNGFLSPNRHRYSEFFSGGNHPGYQLLFTTKE